MTQDYEPIELNENTPEPKEDGAYIIYINEEPYRMVSRMTGRLGGYWKDMDFEDCRWSYIAGDIDQQFHPTIQSLAAHDAQIRAAALKLTDEELGIAASAYIASLIVTGRQITNEDRKQAMGEALSSVTEHRKGPKQ